MNKLIASPVQMLPNQNARIMLKPMYNLLGFTDDNRIFVQSDVNNKLLGALDALPDNYGFVIWDVYRPRKLQGIMFDWMKGEVKKRNPLLDDGAVHEMARKYMSPPSQVGDAYCPPHLSGGAVDLTLYDIASGNELKMGTPFDDCSDIAHAMHYETKPGLTPEEIKFRDSRRILRGAMMSVGFTCYEYEWWHFDYGDVFWSRITGQPQMFGPLFGDNDIPV